MENREIEKEPDIPELSDEEIDKITKICFRDDDILEPADLIFIFGTSHNTRDLIDIFSNLLSNKLSNKIFFTGGIPKYIDSKHIDRPESTLILDCIDKTLLERVQIYTEISSKNTMENVTEALKVLDFTEYKKVIYIFKSHAAGRGYLTLKKYLPNTKLIQKTFNASYHDNNQRITKDNWYKTELYRKRVYGEYLRIKKYSEKGDIASYLTN